MSQERTHSLSEKQIALLREQKILGPQEFAYLAGDLVVAEDPVTGQKRVIGQSSTLNEDNRRVLKG